MSKKQSEDIRKAFARRFQTALLEIGYSPKNQKALGVLFSVSGQAVRKWVEGESHPSSVRMASIAMVLGVRRAWLQDGEPPMRPSRFQIKDDASSYSVNDTLSIAGDDIAFLRQYEHLSSKQKQTVKEIVNLFLEKSNT